MAGAERAVIHALVRSLALEAPTPIARLAERAQNDYAPERQHHNAYYLWELWTRLLCAVAVARYRTTKSLPALEECVQKLVQPSAGGVVAVIRSLTKHFPDEAISRHWAAPLTPGAERSYGWACKHGNHNRTNHPTVGDLADAVTAYRNRNLGHGALQPTTFYREGAVALFAGFAETILAGIPALGGQFLAVDDVTEDAGERAGVVFDLLGSVKLRRPEALLEAMLPGLAKGCVYLVTSDDMPPLSLSPLLFWEQDFILVLNKSSTSQLEFLNYFTGEVYRRKGSVVQSLERLLAVSGLHQNRSEERRRPGRWIGEYLVVRELGRGGMGTVYLARQGSTDMPVALKVLPRELSSDPIAVSRFRREVDILKRCEHPSIVSTLEQGEADDGTAFFAMELVVGCTLADLYTGLSALSRTERSSLDRVQALEFVRTLTRSRSGSIGTEGSDTDSPSGTTDERAQVARTVIENSALAPGDSWKLLLRRFADVADALAYLHSKGVIHRDIKPANVMITEDGSRAIVMDLGIAKADTGTAHTKSGSFLGTLRYASREQIVSSVEDIDFRADLYSLGATMYELLTLTPLFEQDDAAAATQTEAALLRRILDEHPEPVCMRNPALPPEVGIILEKLLQKQPDRRFYKSAADLADDLRAVCGQRPIRAREYTAEERRSFELFETLRTQAATWDAARRADDLLWGEERVEEAVALGVAKSFQLDACESAFFEASLQHAERLRAEREARDARARALSEEAARERAAAERQRRLLRRGGLAAINVILMVVAGFSWYSSRRVSRERDAAVAARGAAEGARAREALARQDVEARRAENDLLQAREAERLQRWDEVIALAERASHNAVGGSPLAVRVRQEARASVLREHGLPARLRRRWAVDGVGEASAVTLSGDGTLVAVASREPGVWVAPTADCRGNLRSIPLPDPTAHAVTVRFSPAGSTLAIGDNRGRVYLADGSTGAILATLPSPAGLAEQHSVLSLAFTPDGRALIRGLQGGIVEIVDLERASGPHADTATPRLPLRADPVSLAVSPDGSRLAVVVDQEGVRLFRAPAGLGRGAITPDGVLGGGARNATAVAFTDDRGLVTADTENQVLQWTLGALPGDAAEARVVGTHDGDVHAVVLAQGAAGTEPLVLSGGEDNTLRLWLLSGGSGLRTVTGFSEEVLAVDSSRDGQLAAAATGDGWLELFAIDRDPRRERGELVSPLRGHSNGVEMVAFTQDGLRLASSGDDATIRIWDLRNGRPIGRSLSIEVGAAMALSRSGTRIALGTADGAVQMREVDANGIAAAPSWSYAHGSQVNSVALSPRDGAPLVAFAAGDGSVGLVGPSSGPLVWHAHEGEAHSVVFTSSGHQLASAGDDGLIYLWDTVGPRIPRRIFGQAASERHQGNVYEIAFSPDDQILASAGHDGTVRLWRVADGQLLRRIDAHRGRVYGVAFSPDGARLVTASKDTTIGVWRVADGTNLARLHAHLAAAYTVRFSPDGRLLASTSEDQTIRLFSTDTWTEVGAMSAASDSPATGGAVSNLVLGDGRVERAPADCHAAR